MALSRRRFLEIAGLAGGALALRSFVMPSLATASPENPQLLLFCYLQGGWDQLLALDPRPTNQVQYQASEATKPGGTGIVPAYSLVQDSRISGLLSTNPGGVQTVGNLTFGPAVPQSLLSHASEFSILRGILMGTLTHDVGKRYFITGKFPRGVTANGSALPTVVSAGEGVSALLPNLAISSETYNETFPAYASGINVNSADDMLNLIRPLGTLLSADSDAAVLKLETGGDTCEQQALNAGGLVDLFKASRVKARTMTDPEGFADLFKFTVPPPVQLASIFSDFKITKTSELTGPKGKAVIAALSLSLGISQAVSVEIARDLDDHGDWALTHGTTLYDTFELLAAMITYLKNTEYKKQPGTSTWEHTTLVVFSEFARTPLINGRDGRDHHQANSCLIAGPNIKSNLVVGGTNDLGMNAQKVDFATGQVDEVNGVTLRPTDVHATVLSAMGLGYDHLSNQTPQVVSALLKA